MAAAARSAAESGNYVEAFRLGIAALDAWPETDWDRNDLETFLDLISDRMLKQMSREEQTAALAAIQTPPSTPAARAAILWVNAIMGTLSR